jgi:hypothetical protein
MAAPIFIDCGLFLWSSLNFMVVLLSDKRGGSMVHNIKKVIKIRIGLKKMINFAVKTNIQPIMKKILLSFVALLVVMTVQAQSVCGSWQSMQPEIKNEGDNYAMISYIDTYNEDGTFVSDCDVTLSSKPAQTKEMEAAFTGSITGTYTLNGDKMEMFYNVNTLKVELVSLSENGKVLDDPEKLSIIKERISKEFKAKAAASITNESYTYKITANGSMLELTGKDGKTDRLMRISDVKH